MNGLKFNIILVSGSPAAGKTTIATLLSKKLKIPLISKDTIKEILFDSIGIQDRNFSKLLGKASALI